jgi:DNA modification methylase
MTDAAPTPQVPMRVAPQLEPLLVPIDSLHADPANVRQHGERNLAAIAASLARFGQQKPIVVQRQGMVVRAGNGTLLAAQKLGWPQLAANVVDMTDTEATAYAIADNRTSELAEWETGDLVAQLEALRSDDADLFAATGFDDADIQRLIDELAAAEGDVALDDPGPEPPPAVAVAHTGDLWILGEHRLLCGDSTNLRDVQRVMGGEKAALVATDPPYLVDYTGERPNDSGKDWTDTYREIDIEDADGFFRAVFKNVLEVLGSKAAIYCWHAHKRSGDIQRIWRELGILDHQQVVWVKPTPVFGRVYWHFRHEPCMMGWRQGEKPEHDGVHEHNSVWEVDWDGKARVTTDHPTSKPVELFVRPMKKHTSPGAVVFEPFSGSGSQIIAAERCGRRCRAIEISPPYVDVAIRRWEQATGKEATLDGDGRALTAIREGRLSKGAT